MQQKFKKYEIIYTYFCIVLKSFGWANRNLALISNIVHARWNVSPPIHLILLEFDIEIDIISYEESLFMAKTLQRAYEQSNASISLEQGMTLLYMLAQQLADMKSLSHDSAAEFSADHKNETVQSMESYTFRYLFFMHEKQMLEALMKIRPRDADSLNRFF